MNEKIMQKLMDKTYTNVRTEGMFCDRHVVEIHSVNDMIKEMLYINPYEGGQLEDLQNKVEKLEECVTKLLALMMQTAATASILADKNLIEMKGEEK